MSMWKEIREGSTLILEMDMPDSPVNILTSEYIQELGQLLDGYAKDSTITGMIFTSAKDRIFIAGANINEINGIKTKEDAFAKAEQGKAVLKKLENLKFPTVAAINGACLGGGLELALGCTARVASRSSAVKIGLPEVQLGILPGFGGSVRLPRLIGLTQAMPLILAGKIMSAEDAFKKGIVDKLSPEGNLRESALALLAESGKKKRSPKKKKLMQWFLEDTFPGRSLVFSKARKEIQSKTKGFYPAPFEVIDLLEKIYPCHSQEGTLESQHFANLATTEVSKSLIALFFMSEKFKKKIWVEGEKISPELKIKKCGVVGAGVMGGGIAQLMSSRGFRVRIKDLNEQALAGALNEASRIYGGALKRRKMKQHEVDVKMGAIMPTLSNDGMKNCEIIVEAVVEDLNIKKKVFQELAELTSGETILASNTSSLPVTEMARDVKHPERVIGFHFFNPVERMPLVEIIRAEQTSNLTLARSVDFARKLGKTVIVTADRPGFLVNRLLLPYLNEAAYLLEQGMTIDAVDKAALDFGMPMGPIELVDQVGIDVGYKVAHILEESFGERMKVCPLLEKVKTSGLLGKKGGKGFYTYQGKEKAVNPTVVAMISGSQAVSAVQAQKRMIYVMINEAARCLEENVIDGPETVDIGMIFGTGFPPFRAGLLRYADSVGCSAIVEDLKRFAEQTKSSRFEPAPYLLSLAQGQKGFYSGK